MVLMLVSTHFLKFWGEKILAISYRRKKTTSKGGEKLYSGKTHRHTVYYFGAY